MLSDNCCFSSSSWRITLNGMFTTAWGTYVPFLVISLIFKNACKHFSFCISFFFFFFFFDVNTCFFEDLSFCISCLKVVCSSLHECQDPFYNLLTANSKSYLFFNLSNSNSNSNKVPFLYCLSRHLIEYKFDWLWPSLNCACWFRYHLLE